jgi:hypothetical protein
MLNEDGLQWNCETGRWEKLTDLNYEEQIVDTDKYAYDVSYDKYGQMIFTINWEMTKKIFADNARSLRNKACGQSADNNVGCEQSADNARMSQNKACGQSADNNVNHNNNADNARMSHIEQYEEFQRSINNDAIKDFSQMSEDDMVKEDPNIYLPKIICTKKFREYAMAKYPKMFAAPALIRMLEYLFFGTFIDKKHETGLLIINTDILAAIEDKKDFLYVKKFYSAKKFLARVSEAMPNFRYTEYSNEKP